MNRRLLPALLAVAVGLVIGAAGWGDLYNETDGQYGGAAKVMAGGGSWLIPDNNGVPRLVKPPLLYWLMAGSMKIFGVTEFAARLPSAAALVALAGLTYLLGAHRGGPWRGFMAGFILLTSLGIFTLGRIVMPEPLFSALIAGALYCALRGHDDPARRRAWFLGFWLCASLACFTKGWHGLLYPLAIVGVAALFRRSARSNLRGLPSWQGLAIFLVINLPWYIYVEHRFPGWTHNLLFAEQLGHVSGSSAPATAYTDVPRWQFLLLHAAWFFPWSLAVIFALPKILRSARPRGFSFATTLFLSWAVVVLLSVLLIGERQDYYAMSMWPAAALLFAAALENLSLRPAALVLSLLMGAGLALALFVLPHLSGAATAGVAERSTAWNTITQFGPEVWANLRLTALLALGGAFVFALAAAFLPSRRAGFCVLVAAALCLNLGAIGGYSSVSPLFSLARAAPDLNRLAGPGTRMVFDGGLDTASSLLFYTDHPVTLLDQRPEEDFFARKFGIGRERYLATAELVPLWKAGSPIVLVTESGKLPRWEALLGQSLAPAARCGTMVILKN